MESMFNNLCIDLKDYKKLERIGKGSYASVYKIENKATKKVYAAKIFTSHNTNQKTITLFMQEVEKLAKIRHPTIIRLFGYSFNDFSLKPYPIIITNFIPNQSIKKILESYDEDVTPIYISDTTKYINILGVALGMKFLHSIGIVHRDLKPENILLNEKYYPLICDLGYSKMANEQLKHFLMESYLGSPFYMAPEISDFEGYTYKVDVYSFSLVVYQLITLKNFPFEFDLSKIKGKECQQLIDRCHSNDPSIRPDFNEICMQIVKKSFLNTFSNINIEEVKQFFDFLLNEENNDKADTLYIYGKFLYENEDKKDKNKMVSFFDDDIDEDKKADENGNINAKSILQNKINSYLNENQNEKHEAKKQNNDNAHKNPKSKIAPKKKKRCKSIGKLKKRNQMNKPATNDAVEDKVSDDVDQSDASDSKPLLIRNKNNKKRSKSTNNFDVKKASKKLDNKRSSDNSDEEKASKELDHKKSSDNSDEEKASKELYQKKSSENSDEEKVSKELDHKKSSENSDEEKVSKELDHKKSSENSDEEKVSKELDHKKSSENYDEEKVPKDFDDKKLSDNSDEENFDDKNKPKTSDDKKLPKQSIKVKRNSLSRNNKKGKKISIKKRSKSVSKIKSPNENDNNDNDDDNKEIKYIEKKNQTYITKNVKKGAYRRSKSVRRYRIIKKPINLKSAKSSSDNSTDNDELLKSSSDSINKSKEYSNDEKHDKEKREDENEYDIEGNLIIEKNGIVYRLSKDDQNAEVFKSKDKMKEITIPKFIENQSKLYKVVQISSESFLSSTIELFKMFNDENITIAQKSFENCNSLKTIIIETKEAIHIEENNYSKLPNLELICMKGKQVIIDKNCFNECFTSKLLTEKKIIRIEGTNNISIGNACFKKLDFLDQIELKSSKIIIGNDCFDECRYLSSFIISESNEFSLGKNQFKKCLNFQNIKLESAKIELATHCFSLSNLTKVEIFCDEITIDKFGFSDLISINEFSIRMSNNVVIKANTFTGCHNLKNISIISKKSLSIDNSSFINLESLEKISIKCPTIFIGQCCFMNCKSLSSIEFDDVIEYKISDHAFSQCESLKDLFISSHQKAEVKDHCFSDCKNLLSVKLISEEIMIGESCFENCSSLSKITVLENQKVCFGSNFTKNCLQLEKILLGKRGLVSFALICCENIKITQNTFSEYTSLSNIKIRSRKLILLDKKCFFNSTKLEQIDINSDELIISKECFSCSKSLKRVIIKCTRLKIEDESFKNCPNISSISLDIQSAIIGSHVFSGFSKLNNVIINAQKEISLCDSCFSKAMNLEHITINGEIVSIYNNCFNRCPNFISITFKDVQNAVIGSNSFNECKKLSVINISTLSSINLKDNCFYGANNLNSITLKSKEITIDKYCFKNCKNLSSLQLCDVENCTIECEAFFGCNSLYKLEIAVKSNLTICSFCFSGAENLKTIKLSGNYLSIGESIFKDCPSIISAKIKSSSKSQLSDKAFHNSPSELKLDLSMLIK